MERVITKVVTVILIVAVFSLTYYDNKVIAAEKEVVYISVEDFSEAVAKEINLEAVNGSYADGLKGAYIIRDGEFSSYTKNITRGDAMLILNRADEYLYGDKVQPQVAQHVIDKRISDIGKVTEGKKVDVAKAYLKGFMKGFNNGDYSTDRELKVTKKITKEGALSCIAMLKDKGKRAKMSPDGQLIRTTKLPKNAKTYPYILASYPNAYYEKNKRFEGRTIYDMNGNLVKFKSGVDYFNPVDVDNFSAPWYKSDFAQDKAVYHNIWVDKAESYVSHVFNVDYRKINDNWVEDVVKLSVYDGSVHSEWYQERLEKYVGYMKEAKTIVKSSSVSADKSSMYYFNGDFYIRVHVRYQIVSSNISPAINEETLVEDDPYKAVLFSTGFNDLRNYKPGKWVDSYFDVCLTYSSKLVNLMGVSTMDININN